MAPRWVVLTLGMAAVIAACKAPQRPTTEVVEIAGEQFTLELALDEPARTRGLMERTQIDPGKGMLFVFPDFRERSFWMANCVVDIDLMFLDTRGTVTAVHEMKTEPPQGPNESQFEYERRLPHFWSNGPARFAIELTAGSLDRLNVRVNDRIALDLPRLKALARP